MLTKKQLLLFGTFVGNVFKEYSYKELKKLSNEKSSNAFQLAIREFKKENLIKEKKVGTSRLYTLNLENEFVYRYLSLIVQLKLSKQVNEEIKLLEKELEKYIFFYSLVVFGSYVNNTFRKDSDLDIAIIVQDKSKEKDIKIALNSASNKALIKIDVHIITIEEFLEMLKVDYENLGKQIALKNLPVHNINIFYKIIKKGIENGFKY
ncbi:MAG: nucleotidyltransferase domain-containing protein [Nanoarchaeota archaeon]